MSVRAISSWFGDRLNPIVVKELRQAVKSRFLIFSLLLLFLLLPIGLVTYVLFQGPRAGSPDWQGGREAFIVLQYILLAACLLFLPVSIGFRLASERSDVNVDLMYITTLSPFKIITGKLLATLLLAVMFFSACTPFMVFTYFLRGIDLSTILLVLVLDIVVVIGAVQLCLFLAAISRNRVVKAILGLIGLGTLIAIYGYTVAGAHAMVLYMPSSFWYEPEFWLTIGSTAFVLFILLGLLYTWSIALVSAPSSNRTLATRLFALTAWLGSGIGLVLWGIYQPTTISPNVRNVPMIMWLFTSAFLFGLTLLMAFHEREEWGPRITRKIPRFFLFRWVTFLLYNGSAGGVLFSTLLFALSVVGALYWDQTFAGSLRSSPYYDPGMAANSIIRVLSVLFLYLYCYGMTALFLRRTLMSGVASYFTWVIMVLLMVLFCVLPMILGYLTYGFQFNPDEHPLWFLAHPWIAAYELSSTLYGYRGFDEFSEYYLTAQAAAYLTFVALWAALVTVMNLGWLSKQLRLFRPFRTEAREERPVEPIPTVVEPTVG